MTVCLTALKAALSLQGFGLPLPLSLKIFFLLHSNASHTAQLHYHGSEIASSQTVRRLSSWKFNAEQFIHLGLQGSMEA